MVRRKFAYSHSVLRNGVNPGFDESYKIRNFRSLEWIAARLMTLPEPSKLANLDFDTLQTFLGSSYNTLW